MNYFSAYDYYFSWSRSCEFLEDKLHEFGTDSPGGWLEISEAGTESDLSFRIPGTEFKYKCSSGYYQADKSNPDQILQCQGNMLVDTSAVVSCIRKYLILIIYTFSADSFPSNDL